MKTKSAKLMNPRRALVPVFLLFLFSLVLDAGAQNFQRKVFQLDFSGVEAGTEITNSISVPAGETWEIAHLYGTHFGSLHILIDGKSAGEYESDGAFSSTGIWRTSVGPDSFFAPSLKYPAPVIVGPATINLLSNERFQEANDGQAVLIYVVTSAVASSTPSNTVVIPSDAAGPVEIILESSVDLVNWTRAEPGEYGASTEKRFFRLRAVAKP